VADDWKPDKGLAIDLYADPRFYDLVKHIMKQRPTIPTYDPRSDNTEDWKAASAQQIGFDIWVAYLRVPEELKWKN
jgi:hypothetical protein